MARDFRTDVERAVVGYALAHPDAGAGAIAVSLASAGVAVSKGAVHRILGGEAPCRCGSEVPGGRVGRDHPGGASRHRHACGAVSPSGWRAALGRARTGGTDGGACRIAPIGRQRLPRRGNRGWRAAEPGVRRS